MYFKTCYTFKTNTTQEFRKTRGKNYWRQIWWWQWPSDWSTSLRLQVPDLFLFFFLCLVCNFIFPHYFESPCTVSAVWVLHSWKEIRKLYIFYGIFYTNRFHVEIFKWMTPIYKINKRNGLNMECVR